MAFADIEAGDLAEIRDDLGGASSGVLVWEDQTVEGIVGDTSLATEGDMIGFRDGSEKQWLGLVADFTGGTVPPDRASVTVDGDAYYVVGVDTGKSGVAVKLMLNRKK